MRVNPRNNRVFIELQPGVTTIDTVCKTLGVRFRRLNVTTRRRVEREQGVFTQPRSIEPVDDGRSRKHRPVLVRIQRVLHLNPMHEVIAHRMSPRHVPPDGRFGVVLKKKVPTPRMVDQAIGIVMPVLTRGKMESGPVNFVVHSRPCELSMVRDCID